MRHASPISRPFSDYYVFQMNDGAFWIAAFTEHQWNGKPDLPREFDRSYETRADADAALARAKQEYLAVLQSEAA